MIFNLALEWVVRKFVSEKTDLGANGMKVLAYVDNIVVLGSSEEEIDEVVKNLEVTSRNTGLERNRTKTEYMVVDKYEDRTEVEKISMAWVAKW